MLDVQPNHNIWLLSIIWHTGQIRYKNEKKKKKFCFLYIKNEKCSSSLFYCICQDSPPPLPLHTHAQNVQYIWNHVITQAIKIFKKDNLQINILCFFPKYYLIYFFLIKLVVENYDYYDCIYIKLLLKMCLRQIYLFYFWGERVCKKEDWNIQMSCIIKHNISGGYCINALILHMILNLRNLNVYLL